MAAAAVSGVAGRQMHAGIDYHRYLAERTETRQELEEWKSAFGDMAKSNGWMPPSSGSSEERSLDDEEEDHLQRFYMTKQNITAMQALNPNANFSTMSPFTLLTNEEFAAYVGKAYRTVNGSLVGSSSTGSAATGNNFGFGGGSGMSSFWNWGGFNFGGLSNNDMLPQTVKPASSSTGDSSWSWISTNSPSTPSTEAPTSAPMTAAPTTAAPTPTPTTATPSTTSVTKSASTSTVTETNTASTSSSNEVDWTDSNCMSPIQNQGQCGDCWAFSTASAVESGQCIAGGKTSLSKYSEQQLVSCDSQNYGCSGGAPVYAIEYIQQNGLCTEDDYPYTSSEGTAASCSTSCSAVKTGVTGYETVTGASDLATAVAKQPVIVAVASGNNAWKQYTGGVISSCDTSELDHAVVVVGYTDSEWKIRNSWGSDWGEAGYIRLERTSDDTGTCGMYGDMSYPTF
ncbi:hypothetical protein JM16_003582 [Phytophthora kernoviae]|uniref:Peptidase C1A papain C-terminal domain-containing protein n=1 Tax=Phytophthora kernoviae TaxID=325452 RepID=A0A8T0M1A4_9STRA|nr:hypothetical protein JM16_003582 [Phytophthora kernoviae]